MDQFLRLDMDVCLGAVTTSAPSYVSGNNAPLSLTTSGLLRVDASGTVIPISGTVTANQGTPNTLANAWPVEITDGTNVLGTSSHPLRIDPTGTTVQPVSGTVSVTQVTSPWVVSGTVTANQGGVWSVGRTWTLSSGSDSVSAVQSGTWTVQQGSPPWSVSQSGTWNINNITGTISLPTGAATEATLAKLTLAQSSTTSGQTGPLIQAAVTTAAPTYTTGQTNPLSLTTAGLLRVDASGTTIPISGTVTANQGTSPWVVSGTVAATQSGTWTTGRTWTLSSGTDSVSAVQSGTWNINNISGTISLPTGAATEATLAKLTLTQGSTTSGQSGPLVQGAVTTADPTYTTAQTSPLSLSTAGRLRVNSAGNVASGATDSGNPVKVGAVYNSSPTTFTSGQRSDAQSDSTGSLYVNASGREQTYSATGTAFTLAASATDAFTITGSGTKTIKVKRISISGTNSGNTNALFLLVKRSTANTGGTSSTVTAVPNDSNNAAATASVKSYTVNPTLGTTVGTVRGYYLFLPALASTNVISRMDFDFTADGSQPLILRGTGDVLAVNMNATAITGTTVLTIAVTWVEE